MFIESIQNPKCKNTNFLFYRRAFVPNYFLARTSKFLDSPLESLETGPSKEGEYAYFRNVKVFLWLLACVWGSVLLGAYLTETTELWQTVQCTNKSLQDCQNRSARISFWKYLHEFLLQLHVHQLLQIATLGIVWSMVNFNCTVFITDKGLR